MNIKKLLITQINFFRKSEKYFQIEDRNYIFTMLGYIIIHYRRYCKNIYEHESLIT